MYLTGTLGREHILLETSECQQTQQKHQFCHEAQYQFIFKDFYLTILTQSNKEHLPPPKLLFRNETHLLNVYLHNVEEVKCVKLGKETFEK